MYINNLIYKDIVFLNNFKYFNEYQIILKWYKLQYVIA